MNETFENQLRGSLHELAGHTPPTLDLVPDRDAVLTAGHRVVRLRRMAQTTGGLAAAVVLAVGGYTAWGALGPQAAPVLPGGPSVTTAVPPSTPSSPSVSPSSSPSVHASDSPSAGTSPTSPTSPTAATASTPTSDRAVQTRQVIYQLAHYLGTGMKADLAAPDFVDMPEIHQLVKSFTGLPLTVADCTFATGEAQCTVAKPGSTMIAEYRFTVAADGQVGALHLRTLTAAQRSASLLAQEAVDRLSRYLATGDLSGSPTGDLAGLGAARDIRALVQNEGGIPLVFGCRVESGTSCEGLAFKASDPGPARIYWVEVATGTGEPVLTAVTFMGDAG